MSPATTLAQPAQAAPKEQQPRILVPFVRASVEHTEAFDDRTIPLGAGSTQASPIGIPAYGFLRGIYLEVEASGGTGGSAAFDADGPFSVLNDIQIMDVNGAPIFGPYSGYELYLVNKFGGLRRSTINPKAHPDYFTDADGNFKFVLYIPVEVSGRDALGSLINTNGASSYMLRYTVADKGSVYSNDPLTTLPSVRVKATLDAWSQPPAADDRGRPQETEPPAHGTTQFWSKKVVNIAAGAQTIRLDRVGNYIRNLMFIYRDQAGVRNLANFPNEFNLSWDTRLLKQHTPHIWRGVMSQRYALPGTTADAKDALETGVFIEDYCHEFDGQAGAEMRDGWLGTNGSTRLEVSGTFGAPGTLTVLTNDVAAKGEVFV